MSPKYDVALSFAGEDRGYVEQVASELKGAGVKVFYDAYEEASLWGKNLYTHLHDVYQNQARFTVMFISQHYATKVWTNRERESAQARALEESNEYVLPVRFDDSTVPGVPNTIGFIDLRKKNPAQLSALIVVKLQLHGVSIDNTLAAGSSVERPSNFKVADLEHRVDDPRASVSTISTNADVHVAAEGYDIVLQTELADGSFRCRGFSGVPAASRSWIAIASSGSALGRQAIAELAAEFEVALLGSSPEVTVVDFGGGVSPAQINPESQPGRLKLLILVGAGDSRFHDQSWYHRWESDTDRSGLMILLPPGSYEGFFDPALPDEHLLHRINVASWSASVAEVLPSVLGRAEITSSINRIFISYRRVETLPLALQLFDRLTHERFEVFLDRFSIEPGVDFQRRLTQELEEKSMVVLLESCHLKTSKWTQHEIDFAKRRRLGMIALRMPDVRDEDLLASVETGTRIKLEKADFDKDPKKVKLEDRDVNQWQELTRGKLDDVVTRIKAAHADALYRRRYRLRKDIVSALGDNGVTVSYSAVGPLRVALGKDEHILWPTTRPPQVEDFRSVHEVFHSSTPPTTASSAIIVGPLVALEPDRQEQLRWLREVSQCKAFDEGNLPELASRLVSGDWT